MSVKRIIPDLPKAKAHWTHRSSEIPDFLMVPMSDHSIVRFVPDIPQPAFQKAMNNIKNMKIGYERKETE